MQCDKLGGGRSGRGMGKRPLSRGGRGVVAVAVAHQGSRAYVSPRPAAEEAAAMASEGPPAAAVQQRSVALHSGSNGECHQAVPETETDLWNGTGEGAGQAMA